MLEPDLRARLDGGIKVPSRQPDARRVDLVDLEKNVHARVESVAKTVCQV